MILVIINLFNRKLFFLLFIDLVRTLNIHSEKLQIRSNPNKNHICQIDKYYLVN